MKIENISIEKLTPYKNNAKKHPKKQVEEIMNSIREFGMNDPIGIWGKDNIIVEGHGRYLACKKLGKALRKCDQSSAVSIYAMAKGYNVITSGGGYYNILSRNAITMSKTIKAGSNKW